MRRRRLLQCCALAWPGALGTVAWAAGSELRVRRVRIGAVPPVPLVSMTGKPVRLEHELDTNEPLLLNFVFTTCSSSCSVQTAMLAQLQRKVATQGLKLRLASLSIDPDNDTPRQLERFARQFDVQPGWGFYTGRFDDLLRVQQHFDVYRGSKSSHPPVLLMRRNLQAPWLRVEGFPSADELMALLSSLPEA